MSLLMERWAMMGKHTASPIPAAYQQVEYLEKGNATDPYIEIPYTPALGDSIRLRVYYFYGYCCPFSHGTGTYQWTAPISSSKQYVRNMGSTGPNMGDAILNTWCELSLRGDGTCSLINLSTGTGISTTYAQVGVPDGNALWLFRRQPSGANSGGVRISEVAITRNGADVIHAYSVYRKSDNKLGFYDVASKVFYQCIGSFTKGADVN